MGQATMRRDMPAVEGPPTAFTRLRRVFPLLVIAGAFVWSAVTIVRTRVQESPPGTITLHISHWQLETGVKDALEQAAQRYQKLHPQVRVVQNIIPESSYGTWLTTNLLGGTAPDMVEIPDSSKLPQDIMISYYGRYFLSLTPYVNRINPYNKGTALENVPLRRTYKEGMRRSYVQEYQDYLNIPLSLWGVRVFYNKDLYRTLTGRSDPPRDFRDFQAVCETIRTQKDARGRNYLPICAAADSMWAWEYQMFDPLTYAVVRRVDYSRDGLVTNDELYAGFKSGMIDFQFPPIKARYKLLQETTRYFPLGHTGLARDDSVFQFAQQRGVFLSTGTWDARSLMKQAEGKFEVGVMDFPRPRRDDPEYGPFIEGPQYEGSPEGGFPVGITRASKHPDVVLDFLFFLVSQKENEELNRVMGWIPIVNGTKMEPFFDAFDPHLEGVYGALSINLGGDTRSRYQQLYALYQSNQLSYADFVAQFEPFYKTRGLEDFRELQRNWRRALLRTEQLLASLRAEALAAEPVPPPLAGGGRGRGDPRSANDEAESKWVRYRAMTASRQVLAEVEHYRRVATVERGPDSAATGPYEYSPELLQKVRARLAAEAGK
jgi:raffinose/stachyose/melibiose transport system substrate-binding protein